MKRFEAIILIILVGFISSNSYCQTIAFLSSSNYDNSLLAKLAFDNNPQTRWASKTNQKNNYLQIDFGKTVPVNNLSINWEAAYATEYEIQTSNDSKTWQTAIKVTNGKGGKVEHNNLNARGRYLKINCLKYGPHPLFSIWEVKFDSPEIKDIFHQHQQAIKKIVQDKFKRIKTNLLEKNNCKEIVFAARRVGIDPHWYANFGYYAENENRKPHKPGGKLCKLNLETGDVKILLDAGTGSIRDPEVNYDAEKILFSYRKDAEEFFNIYEINIDGSNLKQITSGPFDDLEPAYLPDGKIVFVSSRCKRWVNCWLTQVAILYRCNADGTNIQQLSANIEQDNTPAVLPDGRILYTRWEYIDRSQVDYHHLWAMRPDGTNQTVYFGNLHPSRVFIDARPIPGTTDVLMIDSPGHGRNEHAGQVSIVTSKFGPDQQSAVNKINLNVNYRDPYPISKDGFIIAIGNKIQMMDSSGATFDLYRLDPKMFPADMACHEPRPVIKRKRERIIPDMISPQQATGKLLLTNVYIGRNMENVKPGTIKKLLVMESLPKPINYTGGMDPLTYGGSFTLERILGTIPVEPDGSAYMELPANRSFFFIALDENDNAVKRMQSFTSVAPGEISSCVGCHEHRTTTPRQISSSTMIASTKPPYKPEPIKDIPQVFDFPRDIQPILDKHCIECHNPDKREGKVLLTGDRGPMFSLSYAYLTIYRQFVDGRNQARSNYPPYTIGAHPSKLLQKVLNKHGKVNLSDIEIKKIRYWIESAATYPGTYASLGTGMIGGYQENAQVINSDHPWPESIKAAEAITRRCYECHKDMPMARKLSDENGLSFWQPDLNKKAITFSRHCIYNLTNPEKSIILMAPLAKTAGGYADDKDKYHPIIFKDSNDTDYQIILAMIQAGKNRLDQVKRFDMPGFKPRREYIREMKKYGILPNDFDIEKENVNIYKLDEQYWQSLWYYPYGTKPDNNTMTVSK